MQTEMGKNSDLDSLIRLIVNTITHQIVVEHTHKPESKHFLNSEIIEYRSQTEKAAKKHTWNNSDKEYAEKNALEKIKEKLAVKYSDVDHSEEEIIRKLKKVIKEVM